MLLVFEGVTRRYDRASGEIVALDGVSFDVVDGEMLTILGGARSGKSTLLRLAAGLEPPDEGSVRFRGRDTRTMRRRDRTRVLRHEIGCVFEPDSSMLGREVVEFVSWPLVAARQSPPQASAEARKMLRRVGAEACAGATLAELSTSEQTRIVIAQACVREPVLLLADEPVNAMKPKETDEILQLLRSIAAENGMAVVMTAGEGMRMVGRTRIGTLSAGRLRVSPRHAAEVVEIRRPG